MTDDELLTPTEVSEILRTPIGTLSQWRHRGHGPKAFRLGSNGSVRYRRSVVTAWIEECETATGKET